MITLILVICKLVIIYIMLIRIGKHMILTDKAKEKIKFYKLQLELIEKKTNPYQGN